MLLVLCIIFLLSFIGSFIFAGFETGFISWNALKVEHLALQGGKRSSFALMLQKNSAMLITTVLIGNNIALVGMSLSLENLLEGIPVLGGEVFQNGFLTISALIFCELLPKSLFRIYSFRLTMRFVPLVTLLFFLFSPLSKLISLLTKGGEVTSRKEAMAAIAMEGGRHKLFSTIYGDVVDCVIKREHHALAEICRDLSPVALKSDDCWEVQRGDVDPDELAKVYAMGVKIASSEKLSSLLSNSGFLSQQYFFVEDLQTVSCYLQEETFEKLFLFSDKD